MDPSVSLVYLPTAITLGALHALEPGHAKTLTAAYLIGVKGTKRDAILLGISVAATHSILVILLSVAALWLGREAFADQASRVLQVGSAVVVILLGIWLLWRRIPGRSVKMAQSHGHSHAHPHPHPHPHAPHHPHPNDDEDHGHEDHSWMDEDEHARVHAATLPAYVTRGERPTFGQILMFGAAGGMVPCPASVSVMLLALSTNAILLGTVTVLCFSLGLAVTLVGIGLAVVSGVARFASAGRLAWVSSHAPVISAVLVILSGVISLFFAH